MAAGGARAADDESLPNWIPWLWCRFYLVEASSHIDRFNHIM